MMHKLAHNSRPAFPHVGQSAVCGSEYQSALELGSGRHRTCLLKGPLMPELAGLLHDVVPFLYPSTCPCCGFRLATQETVRALGLYSEMNSTPKQWPEGTVASLLPAAFLQQIQPVST